LEKERAREAVTSMIMLVSWEIWTEKNASVFQHHTGTFSIIIAKIKEEETLWGLAGARSLRNVI
jgi:hypothetical protein